MFSSALGRKGERILKFPVPDSLSLSSLSLSFSLSPFLLANGHKGTLSLGKKKRNTGGLLHTLEKDFFFANLYRAAVFIVANLSQMAKISVLCLMGKQFCSTLSILASLV